MKKQKLLMVLISVILMLILTGCKKPNFGVHIHDDKNAEIIAQNALQGMSGTAASLEIGEGQKLSVVPSLTKGELNIKISAADTGLGIDASISELENMVSGGSAPALDLNISGTKPAEYDLEPGEYSVSAAVLSRANGTVLLTVK